MKRHVFRAFFERGCSLDVAAFRGKYVPLCRAKRRERFCPTVFVFVKGTSRIFVSVEERNCLEGMYVQARSKKCGTPHYLVDNGTDIWSNEQIWGTDFRKIFLASCSDTG